MQDWRVKWIIVFISVYSVYYDWSILIIDLFQMSICLLS